MKKPFCCAFNYVIFICLAELVGDEGFIILRHQKSQIEGYRAFPEFLEQIGFTVFVLHDSRYKGAAILALTPTSVMELAVSFKVEDGTLGNSAFILKDIL